MRDYGKKPGSSLRILPSYSGGGSFAMGGAVLGEHIRSHRAPDPDPDIQRPPPADADPNMVQENAAANPDSSEKRLPNQDAPGDKEGEYGDMMSQAQEDI